MKKALVIGINYYKHVSQLYGCVNDAYAVKGVLERNSDGSVNFALKLIVAAGEDQEISRSELRAHIQDLFSGDGETALLYFAGHGHIESTGGYLLSSDATANDGLPLSDIMSFANSSRFSNRIVVLDSCHSGVAGTNPIASAFSELKDGTTILTASTSEQYASEINSSGVFTTLLVDALQGAASNLMGDITPGSVYAHIDQSLGGWQQRPVFKTNVNRFVSLRKTEPPIELSDLKRLAELFPEPGYEIKLDPSFEPEQKGRDADTPSPNPSNTAIFSVLQKYNRLNLLRPEGAPHMWHAAMQSKSCKLTALGEHYRRLVEQGVI